MANPSPGEWHDTLAAVEQSIGQCLAALDRYESAFSRVLSEQPLQSPAVPEPAPTPKWEPTWKEKLNLANQHADEVEKLLAEQEAVWGQWQQSFQGWRELLNRRPGGENRSSNPSSSHQQS